MGKAMLLSVITSWEAMWDTGKRRVMGGAWSSYSLILQDIYNMLQNTYRSP